MKNSNTVKPSNLSFIATSLFLKLTHTLCYVVLAGSAWAAFPEKPIRVIVTFPPGGSTDVFVRKIAERMSTQLGQPVVVENRPGSGGIIAAMAVKNAAADGYTLLLADTGTFAISPYIYAKVPYDILGDFLPITEAASAPFYLVVNAKIPARNAAEFLSLVRANPNLNYGSSGNGSPHHLCMEQIKGASGISMVHVPYRGMVQTVPAVMSGEVSAMMGGWSTVSGQVRAGNLRVLAIATPRRMAATPEVPTLLESGMPVDECFASFGFMAPASTPDAVVAKLNREIVDAVRSPGMAAQLEAIGIYPIAGSAAQFGDAIRLQQRKLLPLVRSLNIRVD